MSQVDLFLGNRGYLLWVVVVAGAFDFWFKISFLLCINIPISAMATITHMHTTSIIDFFLELVVLKKSPS